MTTAGMPARVARPLCCGLLVLAVLPALADDSAWQFNGFGNLGVARSSFDEARYRYNPIAEATVGESPTARVDTLAGAQVRYLFSDSLNGTVQVALRDPPLGAAPLKLTWAYLGAQLTPQTELKLGRYMPPYFLFTDTRQVRFAQPWVRPQGEVYSLIGNMEAADGGYLRHLTPLGGWTLASEGFVGTSAVVNNRTDVRSSFYGVALTLYDTAWTLRVMAQNGTSHLTSPSLDAVLGLLYRRAPALAPEYAFSTLDNAGYYSVGLRFENERWLLLAELAQTAVGDSRMLAHDTGGYVTAGYHVGDWLPYLGFAARRSHNVAPDPRIADPIAATVVARLLASQNHSQDTVSVGLRWDLMNNLALKWQFDRVQPRPGALGTFTAPLPAGHDHSDVLSVAAHFLF